MIFILSSGFGVEDESESEFPLEGLLPEAPNESGMQPDSRKLMTITTRKFAQREFTRLLTCYHLLLYKNQQSQQKAPLQFFLEILPDLTIFLHLGY